MPSRLLSLRGLRRYLPHQSHTFSAAKTEISWFLKPFSGPADVRGQGFLLENVFSSRCSVRWLCQRIQYPGTY